MAIKILSQRPSSRDPEKIYYIREDDKGNVWCDCPACEYGGQCYEMSKVRTQREYAIQLKVKHQLNPNPLPSMAEMRAKQWAYIEERKRQWLLKYPQDQNLPQYEKTAAQMRKEGLLLPEQQVLESRERLLKIKQLFDRKLPDLTTLKSNGTAAEPLLASSSVTDRRKRQFRSLD